MEKQASVSLPKNVPVPVSTLGGWHPAEHVFVQELVRTVASCAMERVSKERIFRYGDAQ